jgi:hypothetical protein
MEEYMNSVISQLSSVAIDSDYITYDYLNKDFDMSHNWQQTDISAKLQAISKYI